MLTINTVEAIEQLRLRLHDRAGRTWDDAEILGALDASFRQVFTVMRTHGQSVGLDTEVDLEITSLEPATATHGEMRRLGHVWDPEQPVVELVGASAGRVQCVHDDGRAQRAAVRPA